MRNVISLSNIPHELHQWFKDQAAHRSAQMGKRVTMYQLIVAALEDYKHLTLATMATTPQPEMAAGDSRYEYYLVDGTGPFPDLRMVLAHVDLKGHKRPKHNRYDRLSNYLKSQIQRREKTPPLEQSTVEVPDAR